MNEEDFEEEQVEDEEYYEEFDEEELEEQEAEEQEELEAVLEENKKKAEAAALKPKLTAIATRITTSGEVALKSQDKDIIKQARQHKNLAVHIAKIYSIIAFNKIKRAMKRAIQFVAKIASSGPIGFWAVIIGLIFLVAICIFASIFITVSADGTTSSPFGITGKDFYGARMVYKDDEQATKNIIEDYVEFVQVGVNATTAIKTATKEETDFDVELTVNIALPSDDYDYSQFNEENFKTNYPQLHALVFDVAKLVYKQDNNADTTATTLVECVDGILYFGYGRTVIADVSKLVSEQIIANTTFTSDDTEGQLTKADIDAVVQAELNELYDNEKYELRTEKLFIKDYILNDADEKLSGITEENYVAMLFMPKNNVVFDKFSFSVVGKNLSDFTINLTNDGSEIVLTKDDYDYSTDDGETNRHIYMSNQNLNVSVNSYTAIEANMEMFEQEHSLFDIMNVVENYSNYLELNEQTDVYTFNNSGVVVSVNCSEPFTLVDYETVWAAN